MNLATGESRERTDATLHWLLAQGITVADGDGPVEPTSARAAIWPGDTPTALLLRAVGEGLARSTWPGGPFTVVTGWPGGPLTVVTGGARS
jgi:hypothetical protein